MLLDDGSEVTVLIVDKADVIALDENPCNAFLLGFFRCHKELILFFCTSFRWKEVKLLNGIVDCRACRFISVLDPERRFVLAIQPVHSLADGILALICHVDEIVLDEILTGAEFCTAECVRPCDLSLRTYELRKSSLFGEGSVFFRC